MPLDGFCPCFTSSWRTWKSHCGGYSVTVSAIVVVFDEFHQLGVVAMC
jgi:hypothetical protein